MAQEREGEHARYETGTTAVANRPYALETPSATLAGWGASVDLSETLLPGLSPLESTESVWMNCWWWPSWSVCCWCPLSWAFFWCTEGKMQAYFEYTGRSLTLKSGGISRLEWIRFFSKVSVVPGCSCRGEGTHAHWLWQGKKVHKGYGQFYWRGKWRYAHVFAWTTLRGDLPDGLYRDHVCQIKHCVNPACLDVVTSGENTRRSPHTLASKQLQQTHCKRGHLLEGENLTSSGLRYGKRWCRICVNHRGMLYKRGVRARRKE